MDAYDLIYSDITEVLNKPNIEQDDNVISLFDLYNILNLYFEDLRSIYSNNKLFTHNEPLHIKSYKKVEFFIGKESLQIKIRFDKYGPNYFNIINDIGSENLYIETKEAKSKKIKTFMKKHYDEIMYVFSILKKYENFDFNPSYRFEYGNYMFHLYISLSGKIELYIHFKNNFNNVNNIEEVFKRNYYGKENLGELIKNNQLEIAKKISIDINTLDSYIVDVINKNKKNDRKILVK